MLNRNFRTDLQTVITALLRTTQVLTHPASINLRVRETSIAEVVRILGLPNTNASMDYAQTVVEGLGDLLAKAHVYEFPKADNTTDAVVFGLDLEEGKLKVLLIERGREGEPFYGCWALPGGFLDLDEDIETCARRELEEETGLKLTYFEQLATFGRPGRDPRGRVISVAYWGLVKPQDVNVVAADDAKRAQWFSVDALPPTAFDHAEIINTALRRLRGKLRWQPVGVWLLPEKFTLVQLQQVYEVILGRPIDRRNFRRKLKPFLDLKVLSYLGVVRHEVGRPSLLYTFNKQAYDLLQQQGLDFEV